MHEHEIMGYVLVGGSIYPRCNICYEAFDPETGKVVKDDKMKPKKPRC